MTTYHTVGELDAALAKLDQSAALGFVSPVFNGVRLSLVNGTLSIGPVFIPIGSSPDLTGTRSGKLVVLGPIEQRTYPSGRALRWLCRCDCGEVTVKRSQHLRGGTKSCGCTKGGPHKHGHARRTVGCAPEYGPWAAMKKRCTNPNAANYYRYGARGVTICDTWMRDFTAFLADMGPRPSLDHSLDRIDNAKGYYPGNCRWATRTEQQRNRRINVYVEAFGKRQILSQWAIETGLSQSTISKRLAAGLPPEEAVSRPPIKRKERNSVTLEAFGKVQPITQWARETGIPLRTIRWRMSRGLVGEAVLAPKNGPAHAPQ